MPYILKLRNRVFIMPKHHAVKLNVGYETKFCRLLTSTVDYNVNFTFRLLHPNKFSRHSH
jgi:hypothetical protein